MRTKPKPLTNEVDELKGVASTQLAARCPDRRKTFPTVPCTNAACPWAVKGTLYLNCSFVAAEAAATAGRGLTLEQIGEMMDLTREGVRQIEKKALRKLNGELEDDGCDAEAEAELVPAEPEVIFPSDRDHGSADESDADRSSPPPIVAPAVDPPLSLINEDVDRSDMENATPTTPPDRRTPEQKKLDDILGHFKEQFPADPPAAFGRFFAKRSHGDCYGRGLLTYLRPGEGPSIADLRLCECARRRRDRFVDRAIRFDEARARGGLGFAEASVCSAVELQLPTNAELAAQVRSSTPQSPAPRLPMPPLSAFSVPAPTVCA